MIKSGITFILILLSIGVCEAQLIRQPEGKDFSHQPKFSSEFIRANKISRIEAIEELKPDGDPIQPTGVKHVYQFDEAGNTVSVARINSRTRDTLLTIFEYVGGRLECQVKNDAAGMYSYCYIYNDEGMPTQMKYARRGRNYLRSPEAETEISTESFEHKKIENQLHTTLYNTSGRPYVKEIRYYDEFGYLTAYRKSFVMVSDRSEEKYSYNRNGWLAVKETPTGNDPHKILYEYDAVGNLLSEDVIRNEIKTSHKEYVYYGENMLLKAELTRDEVGKNIRIVNYIYQFR